jgi:hypothetical protein
MLAKHFRMVLEGIRAFLNALPDFVRHGPQRSAANFGLNINPP